MKITNINDPLLGRMLSATVEMCDGLSGDFELGYVLLPVGLTLTGVNHVIARLCKLYNLSNNDFRGWSNVVTHVNTVTLTNSKLRLSITVI